MNEQIPRPIINTGNNCYIIATLQLVYQIKDIRELVHKEAKVNEKYPVTGFLHLLHYLFKRKGYNSGTINYYKKLMGFNNGQNDAVDFLNIFLEGLEIQTDKQKVKRPQSWSCDVKKKIYKYGTSTELFQDIKNHKYLVSNVTPYNVVELQFNKSDDCKIITDILKNQTARLIYENLKNNITPNLQIVDYNDAKAYEIIDYYPSKYLFVRIQSFNPNNTKKFHKIILCEGNKKESHSIHFGKNFYKLIGVICHIGSTINSGHYISYVNVKGQWYKCNDSNINKHNGNFLNVQNYRRELPYVALYKVCNKN